MVVLTNSSDQPCQVVTGSGLGTVAFISVVQDGKAIEPLPIDVSFSDGMELLLTSRLKTLEPGKSAEIPLSTVKGGPTGLALEMVTWSQAAGTYGALYPIAEGKPLALEVTYSAPVTATPEHAARRCGAGSSPFPRGWPDPNADPSCTCPPTGPGPKAGLHCGATPSDTAHH